MQEQAAQPATATTAPAATAPQAAAQPEAAARNRSQTDTALRTRAAVVGGDAPKPASTTALPGDLRAKLEQQSGVDLADVRVHRDSRAPAEHGAHAFATGNDIHLGPGQEQHLEHEAWHVVQQKQGRVRADGKGHNTDPGLEREAKGGGAAQAPAGAPSTAIQFEKATIGQGGKEIEVEDTGERTEDGKRIYVDDKGKRYALVTNSNTGLVVTPIADAPTKTDANDDPASKIDAQLTELKTTCEYMETSWLNWFPDGKPHAKSLEVRPKSNKQRQGWKLHIAAKPEHLGTVCLAVTAALRDAQVAHKLVTSLKHFQSLTGDQLGKAITIYPDQFKDLAHLVEVVHAIDRAIAEALGTKEQDKPEDAAPGDLQIGTSGHVSTRYGQTSGTKKNVVYDEHEEEHPDDRSKVAPDFVSIPQELLALVPEGERHRLNKPAKKGVGAVRSKPASSRPTASSVFDGGKQEKKPAPTKPSLEEVDSMVLDHLVKLAELRPEHRAKLVNFSMRLFAGQVLPDEANQFHALLATWFGEARAGGVLVLIFNRLRRQPNFDPAWFT